MPLADQRAALADAAPRRPCARPAGRGAPRRRGRARSPTRGAGRREGDAREEPRFALTLVSSSTTAFRERPQLAPPRPRQARGPRRDGSRRVANALSGCFVVFIATVYDSQQIVGSVAESHQDIPHPGVSRGVETGATAAPNRPAIAACTCSRTARRTCCGRRRSARRTPAFRPAGTPKLYRSPKPLPHTSRPPAARGIGSGPGATARPWTPLFSLAGFPL